MAATSFTVVSSTEITAVSPAQAAAAHNIYVTTPEGTSAAVAADEFTYVVTPPTVRCLVKVNLMPVHLNLTVTNIERSATFFAWASICIPLLPGRMRFRPGPRIP